MTLSNIRLEAHQEYTLARSYKTFLGSKIDIEIGIGGECFGEFMIDIAVN
jgi:hypothetical protein